VPEVVVAGAPEMRRTPLERRVLTAVRKLSREERKAIEN
jgi:hypothetical protein